MDYRYKVIPFIGRSRGALSPSDVAEQLEIAISEHAVGGWEFYQLSDVNIAVQPGCIAGLFGARTQYMRFDQLIFRGDKSDPTVGQETAARDTRQIPNVAGRGIALESVVPEDEEAQETFCYHCGTDIAPASAVCPSCGKAL